jgi:hypothetical protein
LVDVVQLISVLSVLVDDASKDGEVADDSAPHGVYDHVQ